MLESENEAIRLKATLETIKLFGPEKPELVPPKEIFASMVSRKKEVERAEYLKGNLQDEMSLIKYMDPETDKLLLELWGVDLDDYK